MKTYSKLIIFSLFASVLFACNKIETSIDGNEDISIELDNSYIQFAAGINTRGALNTSDVLTDNFAVVGYQYPGLWENAKSRAVPNVFKDKVTEGFLSDKPQIVKYVRDGGYYTYEPTQNWTGNKYSFFGYYPSENPAISLFGDANDNIEGDPYFMYTLPIFLSNAPDQTHTSLIDLMTAATIDTRFGAYPDGVIMDMQHRLAAVDVAFRNYAKHNYTVKNSEGKDETISAPVKVEVIGCNIKLNNIVKKAKIYLEHTLPTYYVDPELKTDSQEYKAVFGSAEFSLMGSSVEVENGGNIVPVTVSNPNASLLLIPQKEHLIGSIKLRYKKAYQTSTNSWEPIMNGSTDVFETNYEVFSFTRELVQGRRYYIEVTFTSNAVTLQTLAATEWDEFSDVKHEFE